MEWGIERCENSFLVWLLLGTMGLVSLARLWSVVILWDYELALRNETEWEVRAARTDELDLKDLKPRDLSDKTRTITREGRTRSNSSSRSITSRTKSFSFTHFQRPRLSLLPTIRAEDTLSSPPTTIISPTRTSFPAPALARPRRSSLPQRTVSLPSRSPESTAPIPEESPSSSSSRAQSISLQNQESEDQMELAAKRV